MTRKIRAIVMCERSGVVRRALRARGVAAWSCDTEPADDGSKYHIQDDGLRHLNDGWDLMIAHPPCTFLSNSGAKWLYTGGKGSVIDPVRWRNMEKGARFFKRMLDAKIPRIAVENPIMHGHAKKIIGAGQSQTVQPWQFGHGETKATCLWLKGLPLLVPTDIVTGREARIHKMGPSADRQRLRSETYTGIAAAMAEQWV